MASVLIALAVVGQGSARQGESPQAQPPQAARPAPRPTFADRVKQFVQQVGATVDAGKSTADMVVSSYLDPKGGKTTVVIVNDRRKNLVGFYIYNFGSLKGVTSRDEVYKYLLSTNDAITIGSFFVDGDEDIGYKYLMNSAQPLTMSLFDSIYITMTAVARERRPEIRRLLDSSPKKEESPADAKKAAEEKPPAHE
ncbi:MAG TPA: hypothetical protein VNI02_13380 [Blastocatellia bacterium]|jgi:hypothetical protein|nr:hypothetical protein [Blastocatellia bacterium]